jgi:hypothetical protein
MSSKTEDKNASNWKHIATILDEYKERQGDVVKDLQKYANASRKRKADPDDPVALDEIPHKIFDKFFDINGVQAVITMTNFSSTLLVLRSLTCFVEIELDALFALCEPTLNQYYGRGRGKKPTTTQYDSLFITLVSHPTCII